MAIVGIDLGTTNSLISVWKDGKCELIPNAFGEYLTPSVVYMEPDGTITVGKVAKEKLITEPNRTIGSFKRLMGTKTLLPLGDKKYYPQELSSFVLRKLAEDAKEYLGEEIEEAIISVPAYFNDKQRYATKQAALLAGLKVERLVNEPSAAALTSSIASQTDSGSIIVVDFGGGTLDISIVEYFDNVIEIVAVSGDNYLGGNDFDQALAMHFCEEHQINYDSLEPQKKAILLKEAENCKKQLTSENLSSMKMEINGKDYAVFINQEKMLQISAPILKKFSSTIQRAIKDSGISLEDINDIILVGGSCKMPVVVQYLSYLLHKTPICPCSPDESVAMGVGIYAGIKERNEDIKDMLLTDICPFTLGVGSHNEKNPHKLLMSPIIERNTILPCSNVSQYVTVANNQEVMNLKVYQGENMYCDDNIYLGELSISIPPAPKGKERVEIRLSYDLNGILVVEAYNASTKNYKQIVLSSDDVCFTEEEMKKRLEELKKVKIHPRQKEENQMVLARGERLYTENIGKLREFISSQMQYFELILDTKDEFKIRKVRGQITQFFDSIDYGKQEDKDAFFEEWLSRNKGDEW